MSVSPLWWRRHLCKHLLILQFLKEAFWPLIVLALLTPGFIEHVVKRTGCQSLPPLCTHAHTHTHSQTCRFTSALNPAPDNNARIHFNHNGSIYQSSRSKCSFIAFLFFYVLILNKVFLIVFSAVSFNLQRTHWWCLYCMHATQRQPQGAFTYGRLVRKVGISNSQYITCMLMYGLIWVRITLQCPVLLVLLGTR